MPDKPRLLVIERDTRASTEVRSALSDRFDVVLVRTMARAMALLREQEFIGVYVDSAVLQALRWAGVLIQADEVLEAISDGVAVVDCDLRIIWANPEFLRLADAQIDPIGRPFHEAFGGQEAGVASPCPFTEALRTGQPAVTDLRLGSGRCLRVTATPVLDAEGQVAQVIALTHDVSDEYQQQQKIEAIHKAGEELADLTPEDLAEMGVEDRKELLKYNIVQHMKDLLGLDSIQIRLLERDTGELTPLLSEGMTPLAADRRLVASEVGNGATGYVAATGQSYLCRDTGSDPLYLEGARDARSALTVPLLYHGRVIGTLNVENRQPNAFDERDRRFLEIYARNVASSLNTLELLDAEKRQVASASVEAITRALALPLDEILSDATTALDRYIGHDEDIIARLKHLLGRAREIRGLIPKVGSTLAPESAGRAAPPARLANARILVADADEAVRRAAHNLLGREGAVVETAQSAHEAIALARLTPYSAALVDIRLPDMDGYAIFLRLREVQPMLPVILMTGFGYDPTHALVKARQDGLRTALYKPFRADRLLEAVEQALRVGDHHPLSLEATHTLPAQPLGSVADGPEARPA